MFARALRVLAVGSLAAGALVASVGTASAANGTWTKITTPSGTKTATFPGGRHFTAVGRTSDDVTSVDIVCMVIGPFGPVRRATLANDVPVNDGRFATAAEIPSPVTQCRMRAVPNGFDVQDDYLGSFAGPILYTNGISISEIGGVPAAFGAIVAHGESFGSLRDAGQCGPAVLGTIDLPSMAVKQRAGLACALFLSPTNVTVSGTATASATRVDGHSAYLPAGVPVLNQEFGLDLPQSRLSVDFKRLANGDFRVTESASLRRCTVGDTYPPTPASCPNLVNTGVTFKRVSEIIRGLRQVRIRDSFISADGHKHTINVQYGAQTAPPPNAGSVGYTFPGGSSRFHPSSRGQTVHGLGRKADTLFVRSDMFSVEGDPTVSTFGLTWSQAPQKVQFDGLIEDEYALPYSLTAPKNGAAHLGFAYTERVTTPDTRHLAGLAEAEMIETPHITAPSPGKVIKGHSTTVHGFVTAGANGLPTKVTVNGHVAHLANVSSTKKNYQVSFTESFGRHKITVTAQDAAGNAKSASVRVRNVKP